METKFKFNNPKPLEQKDIFRIFKNCSASMGEARRLASVIIGLSRQKQLEKINSILEKKRIAGKKFLEEKGIK
jgi:hypothetical protein